MLFKDLSIGRYTVHAGCMEHGPMPGFLASVIVCWQQGPAAAPQEIFRSTDLHCGHRWVTSAQALKVALLYGEQAVRESMAVALQHHVVAA